MEDKNNLYGAWFNCQEEPTFCQSCNSPGRLTRWTSSVGGFGMKEFPEVIFWLCVECGEIGSRGYSTGAIMMEHRISYLVTLAYWRDREARQLEDPLPQCNPVEKNETA